MIFSKNLCHCSFAFESFQGTPVIDIKPYIPSYDSPLKTQQHPADSPLRSREEPEGEEEQDDDTTAVVQCETEAVNDVKVPNWVSNKNLLKVIFSDNALRQIQELRVNQKSIKEILEHDPRSVYVREKYLSQIYNFQVDGNQVICKFDDKLGTVTVSQIRKLLSMTE